MPKIVLTAGYSEESTNTRGIKQEVDRLFLAQLFPFLITSSLG